MEKQAAAFLQPPALPEPASSDISGVPVKSLRLFLSNRRPVGLVDAAPLKDELLLRDHHDVPDLLEREGPAVADAPAPQGELPVRNLLALVLERRHVDGLGRAVLVKDEALLPTELGGHGLNHVLTKRGIICLSIPSLMAIFSIVAASSGVAGLPAHPASTRAAAGSARSIVLLCMAFLLSSRAFGRSLRHAAPHEEPHAFILPHLDAPRPAKPHGETFAMPQASIFGIALSPSPSP